MNSFLLSAFSRQLQVCGLDTVGRAQEIGERAGRGDGSRADQEDQVPHPAIRE